LINILELKVIINRATNIITTLNLSDKSFVHKLVPKRMHEIDSRTFWSRSTTRSPRTWRRWCTTARSCRAGSWTSTASGGRTPRKRKSG
jgi:hypothetical protein